MWRCGPSRKSIQSWAGDLTSEAESLLCGDYVEFLHRNGRWTPSWAWVNALAHSDRTELARWATGDVPDELAGDPPASEWRRLLGFLADDILTQADAGGASLSELQRSALVPLELELLRGVERPAPSTVRVAAMVLAAVRRQQRPR